MVQLEEVEDQDLSQAQPGPAKDEDYDSADFVDTGAHCLFLLTLWPSGKGTQTS